MHIRVTKTLVVKNAFVWSRLKIIEIEGKFCTYLAFIWLFRASLFAWTNLLSTYSLIIHHLCVQKITKIQNYIKKYLMRTKSLFDYDHEGTKNNKMTYSIIRRFTWKKVQFLSKNDCVIQILIEIFEYAKLWFLASFEISNFQYRWSVERKNWFRIRNSKGFHFHKNWLLFDMFIAWSSSLWVIVFINPSAIEYLNKLVHLFHQTECNRHSIMFHF